MSNGKSSQTTHPLNEQNSMPDYYAMLGVSESATPDQIKRAYRGAMKHIHPDRARPAERASAERQAVALNEAYGTLTDPAKRRQYDSQRRAAIVQDEIMSHYFGGFGAPGGKNQVYEEIVQMAREEHRRQRRQDDRHATTSLMTMFLLLLTVVVAMLFLWALISSIVDSVA